MNGYDPFIQHRHSIRLQGYDYSQKGLYFLTICVQDRKCLFGKIVDGKMNLNDAGQFSDDCWLNIPEHFPNAVLHEHIVMPNHIHGIIELIKSGSPNELSSSVGVGVQNFEPPQSPNESLSSVGVQNFEPLRSPNESLLSVVGVENFQAQRNEYQKIIPHSIGSIVRGFKTGVTKWFRNNPVGVQNFEPRRIWQRNYYEHVIRNENAYLRIADYIINNPQSWEKNNFFDYK